MLQSRRARSRRCTIDVFVLPSFVFFKQFSTTVFCFRSCVFLIHSGCMTCVQDKNRKVAANSESRNVGGDRERTGDAEPEEPEEPERSPKSKAGIEFYRVPVLRLDLKLLLSVKNCCSQAAPRQPSPGSKICQTLLSEPCVLQHFCHMFSWC